jgi:hypothetical protein
MADRDRVAADQDFLDQQAEHPLAFSDVEGVGPCSELVPKGLQRFR